MTLNPGDLVGNKYRIRSLIGDGGMGTVYAAHHEVLGTNVALKFLHPDLVSRAGLAQRFLQEAQLSAKIQSPHVTRVTDMDQLPDGSAYLVMELLSGESLHTLLEREGKLTQTLAIDYTLQLLAGLEAAHALDVVHRDLKPDNVFITKTGHGSLVKILDFGIAKLKTSTEFQMILTRPGSVMGTPEYMSPEQAYSSDAVDPRSDLYSVGVMLYEMLTGVLPAEGNNAQEIAQKVILNQVEPITNRDSSIPAALASFVHRAISAHPDKRFASASEMRYTLWRFSQLGHGNRGVTGSHQGPMPMVSATTVAIKQFNPSSSGALDETTNAIAATLPPTSDTPPQTMANYRATEWGAAPPPAPDRSRTALGNAATALGGNTGRGAFRTALGQAVPTPVAPRPSSRRIWPWALALITLIGGGAAVVGWLYLSEPEPIAPPMPMLSPPPSGSTTPQRRYQDDSSHRDRTTSGGDSRPTTSPPSSSPSKPTPARATSHKDAGVPLMIPLPKIQLPSNLPPLPSILPSTLPPFLTIPPIFQAAPKPSNPAPGSTDPKAPPP